jgi:hypothetical protein
MSKRYRVRDLNAGLTEQERFKPGARCKLLIGADSRICTLVRVKNAKDTVPEGCWWVSVDPLDPRATARTAGWVHQSNLMVIDE